MHPRTDSTLAVPLSATLGVDLSSPSSDLQVEVIGLFDELRNPVFRYVLSFGLTGHDSEDIVQEAFLALFRHLQLGRSRRSLRGWIFRVAHNLALKRRLTNHRHRPIAEARLLHEETRLDPSPNVEEQLLFTERQQRLLLVLHALPEQDQRCLRLRAEGLCYREIARVLGISLGAVSISLNRSMARLDRADGR